MVVGIARFELVLHAPQNLKEKRGIVRKILGRCRERFPISAAEVGHQDLWQRSQIGVAVVAQDASAVESVFSRIEEEIERIGLAEICDRESEIVHF
ncbi:hypothetical protein SAMN05660860_00798 [Geoalkalibacter ferrihydriticus]|uniref:DUF503 domain-containing protein n=2 Tax=Geoalkalibacter ferrihydriticus TaxID=392333 RepID=A0A0C2HPE8_9BACT|nr:DUF503 domain-containing protein [Geoalkalibacter ferrihydriticus]KIH76800.1 hypothetical protein GFER_06690 [Geoalkalibacter ferrihydriticus DSM 17813]SDL50407.1 hypothetical protein SAMN05660860_00798 [Geoalkalibacter ferrihydriticus]